MSSTITTIGVLALLASTSSFNVNNNRLSSIRNVQSNLQMVCNILLLLLNILI